MAGTIWIAAKHDEPIKVRRARPSPSPDATRRRSLRGPSARWSIPYGVMNVEPKPWWQSKLNWVGIGLLAASTLEFLAKDEMTPDWLDKILLAAAGILVIIFRSVTTSPIANRMLAWFLCAALIFSQSGVMAGETAVVVDDSKPATYLVTVGADGSVSVNPIRIVRPGAPIPAPVPTPDPGSPTAFSKAVQGITKTALDSGATPTTAAALSSVYSLVSSGVKDGSIPETVALPAIKAATDTVMLNVADRDKWAKWRTDLSLALETLKQQGVLKIPSALDEVAKGIDLAIGRSIDPKQLVGLTAAQQIGLASSDKLFENIDLAKLIELIRLIIELLKIFRPM